jgi:hypothetical protein
MNWTLLCKRTEYPKLGYIIFKLRELGIRTRFNGGSWHAEHRLEVDESRAQDAWDLLASGGSRTLDDIDDDHPAFAAYCDIQPDEVVE